MQKRKRLSPALVMLFGVLLPLGTIAFEFFTRASATHYVDPMPTWWHVLLLLVVPLSNLGVAVSRAVARPVGPSLAFANAFAIGVSLVYMVIFLPMAPFAAVAVIYFGLGLVPLAPMLALICTFWSRGAVVRLYRGTPSSGAEQPRGGSPRAPVWTGFAAGILALALAELPGTVTHLGLHRIATAETPEAEARAVRLVRTFGSDERLLQACYGRRGDLRDAVGVIADLRRRATPPDARKAYYRVTGVPFNHVAPPASARRWQSSFDSDFDEDLGGEAVGRRLHNVSLVSSSLDGHADSESLVGYLEWTMVFRNRHPTEQREARAQIRLPTGGTVSRLSLWIDGEPREAAFGGRSQTRQAYQSVAVVQRRDPVLVTTSGRDRVLMQCFPILPAGGEMKVRLGITVPLELLADDLAALGLPRFSERNFAIPGRTLHRVWIDSHDPLWWEGDQELLRFQPAEGKNVLRGDLRDEQLFPTHGGIRLRRPARFEPSWTPDPHEPGLRVIQDIVMEEPDAPEHLVVLVDASEGMDEAIDDLARAVLRLPDFVPVHLVVASDSVQEIALSRAERGGTRSNLARALGRLEPTGGADNVPALAKAWDLASRRRNGAVLWVHSGQPVVLESVDRVNQLWKRLPDGPRLIDVQARPGPHRIAESLDPAVPVVTLPELGSLEESLGRLFSQWEGRAPRYHTSRRRVATGDAALDATHRTSAHLARLWARDEVERLGRTGNPDLRREAVDLGTLYQLVSSVTGAVVLETQAQYDAAGLKPVSPSSVPSIPEPETWALFAVVASLLAWQVFRGRAA